MRHAHPEPAGALRPALEAVLQDPAPPSEPTGESRSVDDLLGLALDQVGEGVVVADADGRIVFFNPTARRLVGRGETDLPPEQWAQYYRLYRADGVTPFPPEELPLVRAVAGEAADRVEMLVKREDDDEGVLLSVTGRPLTGAGGEVIGGVVTFRDIGRQRATEERLATSESRYRALTSLISDWAYELEANEDGKLSLVWMTDAFVRATGYTKEQVVDRGGLDALIHPSDRDAMRAHVAAVLRGITDEREMRVQTKDAGTRWIRNHARAIHDPETGRVVRVLGAARDVTGWKLSDPLTGLPNRAAFLDRLSSEVALLARGTDAGLAVLYADLDRFQVCNQSLGYSAGDDLLRRCARRLERASRPGDVVAHVHADEFAILMTELSHPSEAVREARDLIEACSRPVELKGTTVAPRISVGIAFATSPEEEPVDLLRAAQTAVSRAKAGGGARCEVYDPAMREAADTRLRLEASLRAAVGREDFPVRYQPVVRLSDGRLSGFEALVRWEGSESGAVSPDEFVPLAEETGLIVDIGRQVLLEACRQMRGWKDVLPRARDLVMSVNVSARQLSSTDLLDRLDECLEESGLEPQHLELEITETAIMQDPEAAEVLFREVRRRGVRIGIDDFGTGHSSLSYLRRFDVDTLKIDQSFVRGLAPRSTSTGIVDVVVALARHLGLGVIAEGVETEEQLHELRELGCPHAQGFLFARPMNADAAEALIAEDRVLASA